MAQMQALTNMTSPRPLAPDTVQAKMDETFHSLNRSRSVANLILQHVEGPQLSGSADAQKSVPTRSIQRDAEDAFNVAQDVEELLIRIQTALGTGT